MRVILGSSSPRRAELIRELYPLAEIMPADIDEKAIRDADPRAMTMGIALAKAAALTARIKGERAILVTADTVVMCDGELREKAVDAGQARRWLWSYNGRPAVVTTSVVVADVRSGQSVLPHRGRSDMATVWFKDLTEEAINRIIADGSVLGCAGSFMTEHPLMAPHIAHVRGDVDTVQGLSRRIVRELINQVYGGSRV